MIMRYISSEALNGTGRASSLSMVFLCRTWRSAMKKRVLVVDDDSTIRVLCSEALNMAGYTVDRASDGGEALKNLSWLRYDLVISDVDMPVLDGIGLYLSIIKEHPYLRDRVLFMTGSVSNDVLSTLELMKQRYLIKPFKISHLLDVAEEIMKDRPGTPLN